MEKFTKVFSAMICQTLFEKDKHLFAFMVSYKTLEASHRIDFR
jgi:hypothetical protein